MVEKKWAEMMRSMSHMDVNIGGSFNVQSPHNRDQSGCHSTQSVDPFVGLKQFVSCRLALHVNKELTIVAKGTVLPWKEGSFVHSIPLTMENAHVCIEEVICGDVPLPVPRSGFTMVGEAQGSFAQWPKSLIFIEEKEHINGENAWVGKNGNSGEIANIKEKKVNSITQKPKRKDNSKDANEPANKVRKQYIEKNTTQCDKRRPDDARPLSGKEVGELSAICRSLEEKLCTLSKNDTIKVVSDESVYNYKSTIESFLTIEEIRQMFRNEWLNVVLLQTWEEIEATKLV